MDKYTFKSERAIASLADDKLGRKALAENVFQHILMKMEPPNVFGIYGDWGSGKTSFLQLLSRVIEDAEFLKKIQISSYEIRFVNFEPWKYEYSKNTDLLFALLSKINDQLMVSDDPGRKKQMKSSWSSLGSAAVKMSQDLAVESLYSFVKNKIGIDFPEVFKKFQGTLNTERIEKMGKMLPEYEQWFSQFDELSRLFAEYLEVGLKSNELLIICIDDLDRCLPDEVIRLLEAIKNFLYQDKVIFVLAIDQRVVSRMIEKKYGLGNGYGSEYLEKIINYTVTLPKSNLSFIVEEILQEHSIDIPNNTKQRIINFSETYIREPRRVKRIFRQFAMKKYLAFEDDQKKVAEIYADDCLALYAFLSVYLNHMWPNYFSGNLERVRKIVGSLIGLRDRSPSSDPSKHAEYKGNIDFIPPEDLSAISAILRFQVLNRDKTSNVAVRTDDLMDVLIHLGYTY